MSDELLKQIIRDIQNINSEVKSLKFEMHDRFNELKRTIDEHNIENIKADEVILKTLIDYKSIVSDELVTHEHQFNVINNKLLRVEAEIDRLKSR